MVHVVTVHWNSEVWIGPQLLHIAKHLPDDTRVYAALHGISEARFAEFFYAADLDGSHPDKLDALARIVFEQADDQDFIIFLDGDAFPIALITPSVLRGTALAAVRRDEDLGERYPHPCFCLTTVGFWKRIDGTWQPGPVVLNALGHPINDSGCSLHRILEHRDEPWAPLLRSNTVDLHPLWFAVYDDLVYHHGAGFRERIEHVDAATRKTINPRAAARSTRSPSWLPVVHRAERAFRYRAAARRRRKLRTDEFSAAADRLSEEVFQSILDDPDQFHERFVTPNPGSRTERIVDGYPSER